jgi:glycine/D-amino acid oxidase-like deaminating enzyme
MPGGAPDIDTLVIGGGFYGCSLALFQRAAGHKVALVEAQDVLLGRASKANQARIHTGFHYPRSALTAVKSMVLHQRFAQDFPDAVVDDFQMLYAVPRRNTKVSAARFYRLFTDLGAPIEVAAPSQRLLFAPELIDAVFACREWAFDYRVLRRRMTERLDEAGVALHLATEAIGLEERSDRVVVHLSNGRELSASHVFNVTYSQSNRLLKGAGLPPAPLKHELAEIALVEVPPALKAVGVTVMDGPFFSCMPYPAAGLHSLTHVRYTPAFSWTDEQTQLSAYAVADGLPKTSRHRYMLLDARRYMPVLGDARWVRSMFETKTVLIKNERDDGRPILFQRQPPTSRVISIMGGKIDNIYDLLEVLQASNLMAIGAS